jgi:hypothetical protein
VLFKNYSERHVKRGYVQSWNLTLERTLPADIVVSAAYVGDVTIDGFAYYNANAAGLGTGTAGQPFVPPFGRTRRPIISMGCMARTTIRCSRRLMVL